MNERRTFSSEADALDHARQIEKSILATGKQSNIPKEKLACIVAYENLVKRLTPFGKQPEEAVDYYLKYLGNEILRQAVPPIKDLAEKWKTFKYADTTLSHKTKIEIRSYARFIKNKWGDLKPDELRKNDVDILLKKLNVSNNTRTKYLRYIRMFFGWVKDEHFISANPTDGIFYKRDGFNGGFYRPNVVSDLLRHVITDHKDMVGYYSMLTFCGLRPSEGARIQWQDVDLKTKQLYVRKGKTQAR
jgi:integrase